VLSLPVGRTETGLPIGAQIAGRRFEDRAVLEVGRRLEAELGPDGRRPPALEAALG
jgi:Asp-tRNA(Asn)/Glu-tRNA(Gln) amidotransferase A subunit family amidase